MKDITHYFSDVSKSIESTPVTLKEVKPKRAKIDDAIIAMGEEEHVKTKRKRGIVKIRISRKSDETTVCNILENSTDLVDKTPSPYHNTKNRRIIYDDDTPKKITSILVSKSEHQDTLLEIEQTKNKITKDVINKSNESIRNEGCNNVDLKADRTRNQEINKTPTKEVICIPITLLVFTFS